MIKKITSSLKKIASSLKKIASSLRLLSLPIVTILLYAAIAFAIAAIVALATMAAWNHVVPYVFGLPELSFTQAMALLMLSAVLFGNIPINRSEKE